MLSILIFSNSSKLDKSDKLFEAKISKNLDNRNEIMKII